MIIVLIIVFFFDQCHFCLVATGIVVGVVLMIILLLLCIIICVAYFKKWVCLCNFTVFFQVNTDHFFPLFFYMTLYREDLAMTMVVMFSKDVYVLSNVTEMKTLMTSLQNLMV